MKSAYAVGFGLALVAGAAIGYRCGSSDGALKDTAMPEAAKRGMVRDLGDAASNRVLRTRIAELEAQLAKLGKPVSAEAKPSADSKAAKAGRRVGQETIHSKAWRERMLKEDPKTYADMTNRIARWRRERLNRAQRKVDFLASLDVSAMSAAARTTHDELQDMIARREEKEEEMHAHEVSEEGLSDETRRAIAKEMCQIDQRIKELSAQERENLMAEAAADLGFGADESTEVVEAFQAIIENTEVGYHPTGRPPRKDNGEN